MWALIQDDKIKQIITYPTNIEIDNVKHSSFNILLAFNLSVKSVPPLLVAPNDADVNVIVSFTLYPEPPDAPTAYVPPAILSELFTSANLKLNWKPVPVPLVDA